MKKLRIIVALLGLVCLALGGAMPTFAMELRDSFAGAELSRIELYPITTTSEWKEMSRAERVAACQLSKSEIERLSTKELLQYCLEYPFMFDIYAYPSYESGFKHVAEELKLISDLVNRDDYGRALIETYRALPIVTQESLRDDQASHDDYKLNLFEILIAQPEMTETMSERDVAELASVVEQKRIEKSEALDIYGGSYTSFTDALSENPDTAIALAVKSSVKTPRGSAVSVTNYSGIADWSSVEKKKMKADALRAYPTATCLREASLKYNCHSYAWYSQSASNYYWMPDPTAYMTDGSYKKVAENKRKLGDIVYWYVDFDGKIAPYPIHSGIVDEHMQSGAFVGARSKWGSAGLFNHRFDDCPYTASGYKRSYWRR